MTAEIISVGTELLMGQIVNTDAQYIARRLAELGCDHYHQSCVGDNEQKLSELLATALDRADVVITTGGLGPTDDDMTKECVAKFFQLDLVKDEESFQRIKAYLSSNQKSYTPNNEKQAYFPKGAKILPNAVGTAPACIVEKDDKAVIILPGPPVEMQAIFEEHVAPYLGSRCKDVLFTQNIQVFGLGESKTEYLIHDLIAAQSNPTIATYCHPGGVSIRVTAKAETESAGKALTDPIVQKIQEILGDYVYEVGDRTLSQVVCDDLLQNQLTVSLSESCTGGLLSDAFVQVPGISSIYMLGVTSYSNQAKEDVLGVKRETLKQFGAVSEQTAREMAEGVRKLGKTDIGLSTTGIAGPKSDDTKKPVGLVYIGLSTEKETIVKELHLSGSRARIRNMTVLHVFAMIRQYYHVK